jgi:hypothetical protein
MYCRQWDLTLVQMILQPYWQIGVFARCVPGTEELLSPMLLCVEWHDLIGQKPVIGKEQLLCY